MSGIHDPEIAYEVLGSDESVHLVMHFQDGDHPDAAARVSVELGAIEALKLATELVAATRQLDVDTVVFAEALLDAQRGAVPMTKKQRIGLGVVMHLLDEAATDLAGASDRADAEASRVIGDRPSFGGDFAVRTGVLKSATEFNAMRVRLMVERLRELFPSVELPDL